MLERNPSDDAYRHVRRVVRQGHVVGYDSLCVVRGVECVLGTYPTAEEAALHAARSAQPQDEREQLAQRKRAAAAAMSAAANEG